jgi:DNA-binding response OmpR family regulator
MRILLAEDSPVYRHLISGHLKERGFDLVIAKDGAEAWNLLQQPEAPTLVLLDWVLPEIDGIELCRKIRQLAVPGGYAYVVLLRNGGHNSVASQFLHEQVPEVGLCSLQRGA